MLNTTQMADCRKSVSHRDILNVHRCVHLGGGEGHLAESRIEKYLASPTPFDITLFSGNKKYIYILLDVYPKQKVLHLFLQCL